LILVDSSIWIDFFNSSRGRGGLELERMIDDSLPLAVTGVVVAEVLQGLTRDAPVIEQFISQWDLLEPSGFTTYAESAAIFRLARSKGISLTTIDALIAAIALEHRTSVFTLDRDFKRIATMTSLALYEPPSPRGP
jgi:predicted nucleic acid-binding protein